MQIRGMVLSVRPWDFKSQTGEKVQMLSLEVHDETAGLVRGEMRDTGFVPVRKSDIAATATALKKPRFGEGVIFSLRDVQPLAGVITPSEAQGVIPPSASPRPPELHAPAGKK